MEKKIIDALKNAKKEEGKHIETVSEIAKEDREFQTEAKKLKKMLK